MKEIIFATHNENKTKEIQSKVGQEFVIKSLKSLEYAHDIPEDHDTLEKNALQKASVVYKHFKQPCFADDTGLFVDALNGEPGVYSARYAGEHGNSQANIDKLLEKLKSQKNRRAHFKTVFALKTENQEIILEGKIEGTISNERTGNGGFGYDPVFIPSGHTKSFAELPMSVKNEISHRALATEKLLHFLSLGVI